MRFDKVTDDEVEITISVRNLLTLLAKSTRDDSAKEITSYGTDGFPTHLKLHVEDDATHYRGRPLPGMMFPDDDPNINYILVVPKHTVHNFLSDDPAVHFEGEKELRQKVSRYVDD